jgi:hypothetical protein
VRQDPVETVSPQCAIAAAGTHVMDDEQVLLFPEKFGQTDFAFGD